MPTYTIEESPSPAMAWENYELLVRDIYESLLSSDPGEPEVQSFFETHPSMVPGAFGIAGNPSGHAPFPEALVSQPVLPSYNHRKPDFMWLSSHSLEFSPVLIEIESPRKRWFTGSGQSADLTHAINQLREWQSWFNNLTNRTSFYEYYKIPYDLRGLEFRPRYLLIYGRRSEASNPSFSAIRSQMQRDDEVFMTYDRIGPDYKCESVICTKVDNNGYRAISIPPTLKLRPFSATGWKIIRNKPQAAMNTDLISTERKEFIARRFDYWDEWAGQENHGVISLGDYE